MPVRNATMKLMETYIIIGLGVLVLISFVAITKNSANTRKVFKNNIYSYTAKSLIMTRAESNFFRTLEKTVSERYYVFPQVHLSAIVDHKVNGQDWRFAFRHINGKSVDFVLCDKVTLRPTYAVELDDYTHDSSDRRKRDVEVERIFAAADIPLVRFRDKQTSSSEIISALTQAHV